uniref:Fungal lipase-type domain-containing protein n=1 Tax=Tetradesmus obliquus TaxID=3088 RepID=A0A383V4A2_TETOB|eukprot:jgi/Sobl393_1/460/SZX59773.1
MQQLGRSLLLVLLLGLSCVSHAKKDPRTCGNREGAICCQSLGNTCIDNRLTCCNGSCIAAPFNASNPEAACGIKAKPVCSFDQLLVKSSKFNAANAFVMAALSKAVYPDAWALPDNDTLVGSAFSTWAEAYGISNATFLSAVSKRHEVDTEGVCMRDEKGNVFVVFRGTSSKADAATDMDIIGSFHPERNRIFGGRGVQLHDGFTDAYYYVRKATLVCVKGHMEHFAQLHAARLNSSRNATAADDSASKPVLWVSGHSLGAALATLAAADFAKEGYQPVVYTLGSPRVGDRDWQKLYDTEYKLKDRTFRMVNDNDPVARVPITMLGYRHIGTPVGLNATRGSCIVPATETECEPKCVVTDHWTDEYVNATYQCVLKDKAIDLTKCPQDRLMVATNYDLHAAEPGKGTLANESDAVLAAAAAAKGSSNAAGVSSAGTSVGDVLVVLLAAAAAALTGMH